MGSVAFGTCDPGRCPYHVNGIAAINASTNDAYAWNKEEKG